MSPSTTPTSACRGSTGASATTPSPAPGLPNFIPNVPPSLADPELHQPHPLADAQPAEPRAPDRARPDGHLQLGRLGQPAPAERRHRLDLPEQEGRPRCRLDRQQPRRLHSPLYGLPTKYDFFLFSRDHYGTLDDAPVRADRPGLRDVPGRRRLRHRHQGRQVTTSTRTATTTSCTTYVLFSPTGGVIETSQLHAQGHARRARQPERHPGHSETPNNVNPQDLRRADQQGLQPDLRGLRCHRPRAAAGVSFRSRRSGGSERPGRPDHGCPRASTATRST